MKDKIQTVLVMIGMLLVAGSILIPLLSRDIHSDVFRYLYASGAVMLLAGRLLTPCHSNDLRLRRLHRMEAWSAMFYCAAAFLMFWDRTNMRDPIALTLAGAVIQIYVTFIGPILSKKS